MLLRKFKTKEKYLLLMLVMGLIYFVVFLKIKCDLEEISHNQDKFEWLRNKNYLEPFIRPEQETAIVVPKNINAIKEQQFIACFVISAPKNTLVRKAVRQTWGKLIRPIFLIGLSDNETMSSVIDEANIYDDIIVEDFIDSYVNLTIKTAFAMKHFMRFFKDSKFFFKIDDDAFLNVKSLYKLLENAPQDSIIGRLETNSIPIRKKTHRWYIPEFLFKDDVFPAYVIGLAYIIPGAMVADLLKTAMNEPYVTLEDVFFTGVIAGKILNHKFFNTEKFRTLPINLNYPCLYENYIVVHEVLPRNLVRLWQRIENNEECSILESFLSYFEYKIYKLRNWNRKISSNQSYQNIILE